MNKLLIVILVLGVGALIYFFTQGNTDGLLEELQDDAGAELVEEALQEEGSRKVYGSCNAISTASNCIDYIGSVWGDNNMAVLNCEGAGVFSKNACPYSEFGGCQVGGGTITEIIAWTYREGPGEYDEESVPYAVRACNANPMGNWVMPDDLLN